MKTKLFLVGVLALLLSSCIKDEPLWSEADIVEFTLSDSIMANSLLSQDDQKISIVLKPGANIEKLVPRISISEGATISPALGDTISLLEDVVYVVTSQDGKIQRKYTVTTTGMSFKYSFDNWKVVETALTRYPKYDDGLWDNANSAYSMVLSSENKEYALDTARYATRSTYDAVKGRACLLETNKGGVVVGKKVGMVAGSSFMGKFQLSVSNPIKSAKFGQILPQENGRPIRFTGFFKYKSGDTFQYWDKKKEEVSYDNTGKQDKCSVYAIVFKVRKGKLGLNDYLDGTNVQTDDRVVAKATIEDGSSSIDFNKFTSFDVPFLSMETGMPYYELDYENNDYKIAIILSSSEDGDNYQGSVGSTLIVDELEIITSTKK